jgi:hypothetical protein
MQLILIHLKAEESEMEKDRELP